MSLDGKPRRAVSPCDEELEMINALQAQLAEAQKVHQSISETLIRESELTNSWMQRALEAERERDEERADYKRIVGELSDMAGQLEATCQERDAVRAEVERLRIERDTAWERARESWEAENPTVHAAWHAAADKAKEYIAKHAGERALRKEAERERDEAREEVERLGSTLTGATQHSQDVTRKWMDERMRAIAAETAAAHWQAEHGRCAERLTELMHDVREYLRLKVQGDASGAEKMLYVLWTKASELTPAPTGDGPQAGGEGQSRSVQRRQATQRGEPIPTFSGDGLAPETPCVVCRRAPCVCCREYISMCQHGEVVGHCEACKTPASEDAEGPQTPAPSPLMDCPTCGQFRGHGHQCETPASGEADGPQGGTYVCPSCRRTVPKTFHLCRDNGHPYNTPASGEGEGRE